MRRAALALLLLAAPAGAGEITFWDGAALRTEADPRAVAPALRTDPQVVATMAAPDVGLVIEPAPGAVAQIYASNLIAGAVARRFSGHARAGLALGAGRLFSLTPSITERGGRVSVDWALRDERDAVIGLIRASVRVSGSGAGLSAFTPEDAERVAFQTAAQLRDDAAMGGAIRDAEALAQIDRTPEPLPAPRPEEPAFDPRSPRPMTVEEWETARARRAEAEAALAEAGLVQEYVAGDGLDAARPGKTAPPPRPAGVP